MTEGTAMAPWNGPNKPYTVVNFIRPDHQRGRIEIQFGLVGVGGNDEWSFSGGSSYTFQVSSKSAAR